jgi:hypothetical protein
LDFTVLNWPSHWGPPPWGPPPPPHPPPPPPQQQLKGTVLRDRFRKC